MVLISGGVTRKVPQGYKIQESRSWEAQLKRNRKNAARKLRNPSERGQ